VFSSQIFLSLSTQESVKMRSSWELSVFGELELRRFEGCWTESNFGVKNVNRFVGENGFRRNFRNLEIVGIVSERTQKAILTNKTIVWPPFNCPLIVLSWKFTKILNYLFLFLLCWQLSVNPTYVPVGSNVEYHRYQWKHTRKLRAHERTIKNSILIF
jgi:hypothetical protein